MCTYGSVHEAVVIHMGLDMVGYHFFYISLSIQIAPDFDQVQYAVVGDTSHTVNDHPDANVGTTQRSPVDKALTKRSPVDKALTKRSPVDKASTKRSPVDKALCPEVARHITVY